jgi:predicted RNase H-like HicB family nuclease
MPSVDTEFAYTLLLEPDEEGAGFTATVPALPGIVVQGSTEEETVQRAREAIAFHIQCLRDDGLPIPKEQQPPRLVLVQI